MNAILADESGAVLAGLGRLEAARLLLMETVPVVIAPHLTAAEKRAFVLAENKLGELGDWDRDILREELRELVLLDREFDLEITGFDTIEIENLTRLETDRDLDRLPEPLLTPVTRRGDRWEMGDRIAACGDALRAEDVALLMGREVREPLSWRRWECSQHPVHRCQHHKKITAN